MKEYGFDWLNVESSSSLGHIFRPMINIQIKSKSDDWMKFVGEIDSGSPISVFNESDCNRLGFKLKEGIHFKITGVFGDSRFAYIHALYVKIGNEIIKSKIAFTEGKDHKQLIGRIDIFDNFRINLRGKICKSYFIKEN